MARLSSIADACWQCPYEKVGVAVTTVRKQELYDAWQSVRRLHYAVALPLSAAQRHFHKGAWVGGTSDDFAVDLAWRIDDVKTVYEDAEDALRTAWANEPEG